MGDPLRNNIQKFSTALCALAMSAALAGACGQSGQGNPGSGGGSGTTGAAGMGGGTAGAGGSSSAGTGGNAGGAGSGDATTGSAGSGSGGTTVGAGGSGDPALLGAPLIVAPTSDGFGLSVVLRSGDPSALRAHVRKVGAGGWSELGQPAAPAYDLSEWSVVGLEAGQQYEYEILAPGARDAGAGEILYGGTAVTQRASGSSFTFDVLADSHIQPCDSIPPDTETCGENYLVAAETTLLGVAADIRQDRPDFMIHLGDVLDFHQFGFNGPPPDSAWARLAYLNYRRLMGDALGNVAHFTSVGNWDGENGCNSSDEIQRSSSQRTLYLPAPKPQTYPEGGSPSEDYFAFTWGDSLFVVLNVMTYTTACHIQTGNTGTADDWTLGATQRAWLEATLAGASSKWRFLFIHHTVGGNGGNDYESTYGRGGGRAASVGEQALIHQMMLKYGVQIFFYGHDHVFMDMVVDGIHYTLPGSAGAPWTFSSEITGYPYDEYVPESGHGRVVVNPSSVQVDFVAAGGAVLSSYTIH